MEYEQAILAYVEGRITTTELFHLLLDMAVDAEKVIQAIDEATLVDLTKLPKSITE